MRDECRVCLYVSLSGCMCLNVCESLGCEEGCVCGGPRGKSPQTGLSRRPFLASEASAESAGPYGRSSPRLPLCTPESTSSQSYSGENIETAASPMSRFSSRSTTAQGRVSRCPRPPNIPSPGPPPFSALPPPPSGPGSVQGTALCSLSSRDASRSH